LFFFLTSCASFPLNPPVREANSPAGYSFNNLLAEGNEIGDNLMVITFSGGGTRAGALAYGVAKKLNSVKLPDGSTLLDEVKIISSVSGGSFASAYYGLYGKDKFLSDYRKDVLDFKIGSRFALNLLRFVNWVPAALSKNLGKSEIAEKIYDKHFFKGHTFEDMPRKWPFIVINSTDMSRGTTFSFIQEDFDLLCSDLNDVKVARAVVASSAFPGPFTPLTFKNYSKSKCGYQIPQWAEKAAKTSPERNLEYYVWAHNLKSYMDHEDRPYIHVFDGGIADNLGLRPLLYSFRTGRWNLLDDQHRVKAKRIILVVVDAKPALSAEADKKSHVPKLLSVLMNAATLPMTNYSIKTVVELVTRFELNRTIGGIFTKYTKLCDQVHSGKDARQKCYDEFKPPFGSVMKPPYPDPYLIYVQFDSIPDPSLRNKVSHIPTDLQLSKDHIDSLIQAADVIIDNSSEFKRLVKDLGGVIQN